MAFVKYKIPFESEALVPDKPVAVGHKPDAKNYMVQGANAQDVDMGTLVAQMEPVQTVTAAEPVAMTEDEVLSTELIGLYEKMEKADVKNSQARMEVLKKKLQLIANDQTADDVVAVFSCEAGEVEFSKRSVTKVFKNPETLLSDLVDKFGMEAVQNVVKIGVTELSKLLSQNEMAKYYSEERGSRSLKAVRPKKRVA
jgi:hypothetical protein